MRAIAILAALALGGCTIQFPINLPGSLQSQPAPDLSLAMPAAPSPAAAMPVCPPLVVYTDAENAARDKAIDALPPDSELRNVLADYHNMRVADDACLHPAK